MKLLTASFTKFTCPVLVIILICFSSCEEDDKKNKDFTVTLETGQGFPGIYYLLSDEEGNVVNFVEIKDPGKVELKAPSSYTDDTFMLTQLTLRDPRGIPIFSARTFAGIDARSLTWKAADDVDHGYAYFKFSGLQSTPNEAAIVSCNASLEAISKNDQIASIFSYGDKTKLLAVVQNTVSRALKYRMFDNDGNGFALGNSTSPYNIDLSLVTEPLPTKTITAPAGVTPVRIMVQGIKNTEYYHIMAVYGELTPLTIPDPGSAFDGYFYRTSFKTGKYLHTVAKSSPDFDGIQFGVSVAAAQAGTVTFTTTGNYDHDILLFTTPGEANSWDVYCPSSTQEHTVKLPALPAELLTQKIQDIIVNLNFSQITASDIDDVNGYQDFIQKLTNLGRDNRTVTIAAQDID